MQRKSGTKLTDVVLVVHDLERVRVHFILCVETESAAADSLRLESRRRTTRKTGFPPEEINIIRIRLSRTQGDVMNC